MKRLIHIILGINIIAHVVMMLFSCENSMEKVKQFIDCDTITGLMAYDVVIERSDSGMLVAKLTAPVMRSVDNQDSSVLEFPKGFVAFMYENGDTAPTSKISGDYGVNYERKELVFAKHNVVVENIKTNEKLETETLYWNQRKKKIYTRNLVKITSPDKIIFGDSLTANESFSRREIFGIRATMEIDEDE
ncbi:MAG: LPS export ABC transporter periplasmic protein LptC [Bacteroidales bacterium]|nr:LPS export ABC transporter periplasmic protein LptC [Bacteroidales bacterium]MBR4838820.1 LPS export ABC transporter periplasmic protein LptC [Bacteroidales bacterium]